MERKRTLEEYKEAGAWMRLLKSVLSKTEVACSKVTKARDYDKLASARSKIDIVCSRAEDNMFDDFPKLSNQHIDVFYGAPDVTTTDVDKEQTALMRKLVKELFKDNWE